MTRVLVTGAGGFIGNHLVDYLKARGVPPTHTLSVADARRFYRDRRSVTQPTPPSGLHAAGRSPTGSDEPPHAAANMITRNSTRRMRPGAYSGRCEPGTFSSSRSPAATCGRRS